VTRRWRGEIRTLGPASACARPCCTDQREVRSSGRDPARQDAVVAMPVASCRR
jgi:hypothetical protein